MCQVQSVFQVRSQMNHLLKSMEIVTTDLDEQQGVAKEDNENTQLQFLWLFSVIKQY